MKLNSSQSPFKKFLIIQLRAMGDVLISTVLCETLKKNFPDSQVDMVVYPYTAAVLENNPFIDHIIILPRSLKEKAISKTKHFLKFARKQHYDYCIDVLNIPKSTWLSYLSGAKNRIGRQTFHFRSRFNTINVIENKSFLKDLSCSYSIKNRLELLTPISKNLIFSTQYRLFLSQNERENMRLFLVKKQVDFSKPLFFCAPIGNRQWPIEYYIETLNSLIKKYDATFISCPAPNELEKTLDLKNKLDPHLKKYFIIYEDSGIRNAAGLLSYCQLFLGNDGGASHIAMALGTPTFCIYSPRIYHPNWSPKNDSNHIALSIQDVFNLSDEAYELLLKTTKTEDLNKLYYDIKPEFVLKKFTEFYSGLNAP